MGRGMGIYGDLAVFKVILGLFFVLVCKWTLTRNQLDVERNGLKFRTRWY